MLSRERIMWHLDVPICRILHGLKIHLATISMNELWQLCYTMKCEVPAHLLDIMWDMIQKRQRKDSTWQNYLPAQEDG
jgi:hypothetical protein